MPLLSEQETSDASPGSNATEVLVAARWPVGGIRTHLGYSYPVLRQTNHHCTLVVPDDESLPALKRTLPGSAVLPVAVKQRQCPLWKMIRPALLSGQFDLVHAHGMTAIAHTALACLGREVPFVATLHEPMLKDRFQGLLGQGKRWLLGR